MSHDHEFEIEMNASAETDTVGEEPQSGAEPSITTDSLVQVREILLGPAWGDLKNRLQKLEGRFDQVDCKRDEEFSTRLGEIEHRLQDELRQLADGIEQKQEKHSQQLVELRERVETAVTELREKTGDMQDGISDTKREMLAKLSGEIDALRTETERSVTKTSEEIVQEATRLRTELADRTALSSMFSEMALRLGGGVDPSAAEPDQSEIDLDQLIDQRTGWDQ